MPRAKKTTPPPTPEPEIPQVKTAKQEYEALVADREPFLETARDCSAVTIPYLIPPEGITSGRKLNPIYQGVGARCVSNLASKLLMALLPPNTPLMRLMPDPYQLQKLTQDPKAKSQLDKALSNIEKSVVIEIESSGTRVAASEALQHLIVGGNVLLHVPPNDANVRVFHLSRYVVQRDPMGNVLKMVIKESLAPSALPADIQEVVNLKDSKSKTVDVYTQVSRMDKGDFWEAFQEINGEEVEGTRAIYPADRCPYIPLRLIRVDGENYGRGYCELYYGDLLSLSGLSRAILEGSVAASKLLWLVKPGGLTNPRHIAEAENGDVIDGQEEDVAALRLDKLQDFQVTKAEKDEIRQRLETAFLLLTGVQRNAERVTAEEIRALVQELETGLGGIYSVLAQEFQLPLVHTIMGRMAAEKRLPKLPKKLIKPTIVTGVDAIGRGNDLQRLDALLEGVQEKFGPQAVVTYTSVSEYLNRRAAALAVSTEGLIRTEEEVQAAQQQQAQQAMAAETVNKLGPSVIKQMGDAQAAA